MIVEAATPDGVRLKLDSELYSEAVVFKCFYWYGKDFEVDIQRVRDSGSLVVSLVARSPLSTEQLGSLQARVRRDLIDFKTRDIVVQETRVIRDLLVAKAFAGAEEFVPAGHNVASTGDVLPARTDGD